MFSTGTYYGSPDQQLCYGYLSERERVFHRLRLNPILDHKINSLSEKKNHPMRAINCNEAKKANQQIEWW